MRTDISGPELAGTLAAALDRSEAHDDGTIESLAGHDLIRAAIDGLMDDPRWMPSHAAIAAHPEGCTIAGRIAAISSVDHFAATGDLWTALLTIHGQYAAHASSNGRQPMLAAADYRSLEGPPPDGGTAPLGALLCAPPELAAAAATVLPRFIAGYRAAAGAFLHNASHSLDGMLTEAGDYEPGPQGQLEPPGARPAAARFHALTTVSVACGRIHDEAERFRMFTPDRMDIRDPHDQLTYMAASRFLLEVRSRTGRKLAGKLEGLGEDRGPDTISAKIAIQMQGGRGAGPNISADDTSELLRVTGALTAIASDEEVEGERIEALVARDMAGYYGSIAARTRSGERVTGSVVAAPTPDMHAAVLHAWLTGFSSEDTRSIGRAAFRDANQYVTDALLGAADEEGAEDTRAAYRFAARLTARRALRISNS